MARGQLDRNSKIIYAWRLTLAACSLQLAACSFYELVCVRGVEIFRLAAWRLDLGPVAVSRGPRFMDLVYFNVLRRRHWRRSGPSMRGSSYTCRLDQARDMFLL